MSLPMSPSRFQWARAVQFRSTNLRGIATQIASCRSHALCLCHDPASRTQIGTFSCPVPESRSRAIELETILVHGIIKRSSISRPVSMSRVPDADPETSHAQGESWAPPSHTSCNVRPWWSGWSNDLWTQNLHHSNRCIVGCVGGRERAVLNNIKLAHPSGNTKTRRPNWNKCSQTSKNKTAEQASETRFTVHGCATKWLGCSTGQRAHSASVQGLGLDNLHSVVVRWSSARSRAKSGRSATAAWPHRPSGSAAIGMMQTPRASMSVTAQR